MMKKLLLSLLGACFMLLAGGCAVPLSEAPGTPGTVMNLSELEDQVGGDDPIEGANRVMFAVTDFCMDYIVDFIGRIYCTILPRPVIDVIDNACLNLEFPARVISCLLSAEWRGAGDETVRFFANSIIGLGGFFDVAAPWWGFYSTESNFGQAFATWGIDPGCTLTLPFSRAVNVRDTVGLLFDTIFDAKSYIPYCGYVTTINRLVVAHRGYIELVEGSDDRYKSYRQLMLAYREIQQRKFVYHAHNAAYAEAKAARREAEERAEAVARGEEVPPPPAPKVHPVPPRPAGLKGEWLAVPGLDEGTAAQQSLLSLHFRPRGDDDFWYYRLSFFNRDFVRRGSLRRLAAQAGRTRPRYSFWKQPDPDPEAPPRREKLALILPGIGGAWNAASALALAELLYREGYDVATFDSAFHWHFLESSGANLRLPGFLPEDAAAVKMRLVSALEDLRERGDVKDPYILLAGYSMGAMHALKIASTTRSSDGGLKIDRVLAINPPADLRHALERADSFARKSGAFSAREAVDRLVEFGGRMIAARSADADVLSKRLVIPPPLGAPDAPDPERYRLPLGPDEAESIVGLNLNISLRDVLLTVHRERPLPELETPFKLLNRNKLYREIDAIDFRNYALKILPREYPQIPLEDLLRMSGLRSFAPALAADPRLRVIHSPNDPLLTDDDVKFLDRTFDKRICWVSGGGHLGSLCADAVQKKIIELAAPPEPAETPAP